MSFPATALIDATLQPARDYYTMFPQEISMIPAFTMDIVQPPIVIQNMTFESLVDRMIAEAQQGETRFLVVVHGRFRQGTDEIIGLGIPLTHDTPQAQGARDALSGSTYQAFDALERMITGLSEAELDRVEANTGLPKAILKRLHGKLVILRARKLSRVEFRACELGANPPVLGTLGRILGTDFVSAPKVGTFYCRINVGRPFGAEAAFNRWRQANPGTSLFTRLPTWVVHWVSRPLRWGQWTPGTSLFTPQWSASPASGDHLAVRVDAAGPHGGIRHSLAATTSQSLFWFVEDNIMHGSRYPRTGHQQFVLHGCDTRPVRGNTQGVLFSVPLDPNYAQSIVLLGPLRRV